MTPHLVFSEASQEKHFCSFYYLSKRNVLTYFLRNKKRI